MTPYTAERGLGPLRRPVAARVLVEPGGPPPGLTLPVPPRAVAGLGDPDLFWFRSVLVSTTWNENDHVFAPEEVWLGRDTPVHKPVNDGHAQADIVGHIVGSAAVLPDLSTPVPEDSAPDELPPLFHLVTPGVLYARWEDPDLQARADRLVAACRDGSARVSMETWYDRFDFALRAGDGYEVVPRTKATAHLTARLRFFGGDGTAPDGRRVGMVLRGLTFAGKGFVDVPANPASVVLDAQPPAPPARPAAAAAVYSPAPPPDKGPDVNELEQARADLAKAKAEADAARQDLAKAKADLDAALAKAAAAEADLAKARDEAKTLTATLTETTTKLTAAAAELTGLKAEGAKAARLAQAKAALPGAADAAVAALAETLSGLSDEAYAAALKAHAALAPAPPAAKAGVTVAALAGGQPEPSPAMAVGGGDPGAAVLEQVAKFLTAAAMPKGAK